MRRPIARILDGPALWGELRVGTTGRGGWRTYRLVVYPPGISAAARRAMRFRLAWPVLGAALGVGLLIAGGAWLSPWLLTPVAIAVYAVGAVVALRLTRRVARDTLRISAAEFWELGRRHELGDVTGILHAEEALRLLDAADLDPVAYELGWWRVYDALHPEPAGRR